MNNSSSNEKIALSCAIRYFVSALITFFIYLSLVVVCTGFFTYECGYTAYSVDENGNSEALYNYYYDDGEDVQLAEYKKQGIEINKRPLRSKLEGTPKTVSDIIAQTIGLCIAFLFTYNTVWKVGDSDSNLIRFGHKKYDILRGIKIGVLADIPIIISYLILLFSWLKILPSGLSFVFRIMNYQVFMLINAVFGQTFVNASEYTGIQILLGLITVIILPLFVEIAYILGLKGISLSEKIIYKKKV